MKNEEDDADEEDGPEKEGEISTFLKSKNLCFLDHRISDLPEGKKTRLPMNAVDMQWKFSQDHLAIDNYNLRPLGPSPYNPFWSGMQPSMEGYVAPCGGSHLEHKVIEWYLWVEILVAYARRIHPVCEVTGLQQKTCRG
ncbi:hypothetical protein Vadar_000220 [Vaccinium darrowii]|uniref:Uncharacterized protein n=1 Tax=Vaccinium darrowii TaxID=229202 RepID=A0ACB7ZHF1_9ERIC|nr:hypothetical protein Vadar_000220 [Vaccinium darrowii]